MEYLYIVIVKVLSIFVYYNFTLELAFIYIFEFRVNLFVQKYLDLCFNVLRKNKYTLIYLQRRHIRAFLLIKSGILYPNRSFV